ncbi:DUF2183 domain-containing protein [Balneolaceae bacterium ANBcel3]|nr:DUF2183 domain-containing protein [Balneolaceae bacterium ANBcel3]
MKTLYSVTTGIMLLLFSLIGYAEWKENDLDQVDFYSTYAYFDGNEWVVPVHLYVYEPRSYVQRPLISLFQRFFDLSDEERALFNERIKTFVADSESREIISFTIDQDPHQKIITLTDDNGRPLRTDRNGRISACLRLSSERMEELLSNTPDNSEWLTVRMVSEGHRGKGSIRVIPPEGISVISDIDDTIKISEMPAGSRIAVRNAFFKEYAIAPEMPAFFEAWKDYPVHYVSGTPRQFYTPLTDFLLGPEAGYPSGSFHMRDVKKNLTTLSTWSDLEDMVTNEQVTFEHKKATIETIIGHFPNRRFILVGDSGQYDPEIYREIERLFPDQIKEILIRDITDDRTLRPERLEGMTIIPALTVEHGLSQF